MDSPHPHYVVGIGGSAGALDVYKALLDDLPSDTGMAFIIVSHLNPAAYSQLAQILSRHTKMSVLVALAAMRIQENHVYVIPANADLEIENYCFKVIFPRSKRNTQVDLFFTSLAEAVGKRAIGVIVSGYDGDGTKGCERIKENGGITFSQDVSAEVAGMPHSAQMAGFVDYVLSPKKIAAAIARIATRTRMV